MTSWLLSFFLGRRPDEADAWLLRGQYLSLQWREEVGQSRRYNP